MDEVYVSVGVAQGELKIPNRNKSILDEDYYSKKSLDLHIHLGLSSDLESACKKTCLGVYEIIHLSYWQIKPSEDLFNYEIINSQGRTIFRMSGEKVRRVALRVYKKETKELKEKILGGGATEEELKIYRERYETDDPSKLLPGRNGYRSNNHQKDLLSRLLDRDVKRFLSAGRVKGGR